MFLFLQTIFLSVVRTPIHTHIHTTHTVFSHFHSYLLFLFLFSIFSLHFFLTRLLLNYISYSYSFFFILHVSGICFINAYSMFHGILSMQRKNKKFADFYDHVYNISKMRGVINWRLLLLLYSASSKQIKCFVS